jgi:hypothetical protein
MWNRHAVPYRVQEEGYRALLFAGGVAHAAYKSDVPMWIGFMATIVAWAVLWPLCTHKWPAWACWVWSAAPFTLVSGWCCGGTLVCLQWALEYRRRSRDEASGRNVSVHALKDVSFTGRADGPIVQTANGRTLIFPIARMTFSDGSSLTGEGSLHWDYHREKESITAALFSRDGSFAQLTWGGQLPSPRLITGRATNFAMDGSTVKQPGILWLPQGSHPRLKIF